MLKEMLTKIMIPVVMFTCSSTMNAQLSASDTSVKSVQRYQSIIRNNRDVVRFIEQTFRKKGLH